MKSFMQMASSAAESEALVLVIDVSPSMLSDDWPPSRLAAARDAAAELVAEKARRWGEDDVGIVSFAGSVTMAHVLAPVRACESSLAASLRLLSTGSSTNISAGLSAAAKLLGANPSPAVGLMQRAMTWLNGEPASTGGELQRTRRILLLSDGDSNSGPNPVSTAERLRTAGIEIDVIGIASRESVKETALRAIASRRPDGSPRYCFIGGRDGLIREFRRQAGGLRELDVAHET